MKTRSIILSCVLGLIPSLSCAWNAIGHMLVAQVAYENLTPATKKQVDQLSSVIQKSYPKVNSFVAGAPWPDDIKSDTTEYNTWHYINIGFSDDDTLIPDAPEPNVLTAIDTTVGIIKNPRSSSRDKASALLMLAHIVGDLHQPLHAVTQFSRDLPEGDAGGNKFSLKGPYKNLHALWDASTGLYPKSPSRPLNTDSTDMLQDEAFMLIETYGMVYEQRLSAKTPGEWAQESYQIGIDNAYDGIRKNTYPSDAYKDRGAIVASEQITVAGLRLAKLLNELFDNQ